MQTSELHDRVRAGAFALFAVTLLVSLAGCAPYGDSCLRNSDCKGGEVCIASACRLELQDDDGDASLDQGGVVDAVSLVRDVAKGDLVIPLPDDVKSTDVSSEASEGGADREAAADASLLADRADASDTADSAQASDASDASDGGDALDLGASDGSVDSPRE